MGSILGTSGAVAIRVSTGEEQGIRQTMEDAMVSNVPLPEHNSIRFFGVFDGHGGDEAAKYSADKLYKNFSRKLPKKLDALKTDGAKAMEAAFIDTDEHFLHQHWKKRMQKQSLGESGTTVVVAAIDIVNEHLLVANAGDAECVVSRDGTPIVMSLNHKPDLEMERKRIYAAGHSVLYGRIDGALAVSRAIGDRTFKMPMFEYAQRTRSKEKLVIRNSANSLPKLDLTDEVIIEGESPLQESELATADATPDADTRSMSVDPNLPVEAKRASSGKLSANSVKSPSNAVKMRPSTSPSKRDSQTSMREMRSASDMEAQLLMCEPHERACSAVPHVKSMDLKAEDEFILLACDGLFDVMSHQEAVDFVRRRFLKKPVMVPVEDDSTSLREVMLIDHRGSNVKTVASELCKFALARGSRDNVSVCLIFLQTKPK